MILMSIIKSLVIVTVLAGAFWLYKKIKGGTTWKENSPDAAMNKYIDTGFNGALFGVSEKKTDAFWKNEEAVNATRKYFLWHYRLKTNDYEAIKRINDVLRHYEPDHAAKIIAGFADNAEKDFLKK